MCVTPGLTVGFNVGTRVEDVPTHYPHHLLYRELHKSNACREEGATRTRIIDHVAETEGSSSGKCLDFVTGFIAAVRSRTATSAGMEDHQMRKDGKYIVQLWSLLERRFGVKMESVKKTKRYFVENMKQIAKENLEGQCRGEHSCKTNSKDKLKKIIAKNEHAGVANYE